MSLDRFDVLEVSHDALRTRTELEIEGLRIENDGLRADVLEIRERFEGFARAQIDHNAQMYRAIEALKADVIRILTYLNPDPNKFGAAQ